LFPTVEPLLNSYITKRQHKIQALWEPGRPFPEEWAMQGLEFASRYFEDDWFKNPNIESEEHYLETKSMRVQDRLWRVFWLGV
jgi:hypothetical protein